MTNNRSPIRLGADKCLYCHAKVHGRPERCPSCGNELGGDPDPDFGPDGRRNRDGRLRLILAVGAVLIVITGLASRRFPESDPDRAARAAQQRRLPEVMDLVLARKFADARTVLDALLSADETFAEAYIVRSMAQLGLGLWAEAAADATRGARFLGENRTGAKVKGALENGPALADRVQCVANYALEVRAPSTDGPPTFDALLALGQLPCTAHSKGPPGTSGGAQVVRNAIGRCPAVFACPPSIPSGL